MVNDGVSVDIGISGPISKFDKEGFTGKQLEVVENGEAVCEINLWARSFDE